jgi:zinc protease
MKRFTLLAAACLLTLAVATAAENTDDAPSLTAATPAMPEAIEIVKQVESPGGEIVVELSNGMTVIAKPLRTAPVVSVWGLVHTGGLYEGQWLGCGLSHLAEHLVAKEAISGDPHAMKRAAGPDIKRPRTLDIGGQSNAMTSLDTTYYYISAAAGKSDDCIELIADQLARIDITPEDFNREHGVVQRELEMNLDNPGRIMSYTHSADVFRTHPAAVPIIGYAEPLSNVTLEDVRGYVAQKYVPQNMAMVIVGDIDVEAAITKTVESLQGFPAGRAVDHTLPEVPPFAGVRRTVRPSQALRGEHQRMSFQTIPLIHPDLYALDVLSYALSEGRASRLVRTLQFEKRLVTSITTWSWTPNWGKGTFTVDFRCPPGQADAAEQAVLDELQRIVDEGIGEEELQRVKRQKVADYVRSQQEAGDIARTLGSDYLMTGDLNFSKRYTENIQNVTAEQVQAVARKYLDPSRMVITRLVPAENYDLQLTGQAAKAQSRQETFTLPNGLKVILQPTDAVDLVSMALATKGGLLLESPDTNGLGQLMASLSTRGAGEYSAEQIDGFFNAAGGSIGAMCGDNSFLYQAEVLADEWAEALTIFSAVVVEPTFPKSELDTIRPMLLDAIRRQDEHWQSQLAKFFRAQFFVNSPWQMLALGSEDAVANATVEDLLAWHDEHIRAGEATLALVGHFDPAEAKAAIETHFAALPDSAPDVTIPPQRQVDQQEYYALETPTEQGGVMVAVPGVTMAQTRERLALMLLDTIISGYQLPSGWLHTELRGEELVYVVHAYQKTGFAPGAFLTYAGTQPETTQEVVDRILANYKKAADYTPSQDELDRAVNTIVTAEALGNQTLGDIAVQTALDDLYGLGADWSKKLKGELEKLTPEDVHAAAQKYLSSPPVITVITPQPKLLSSDAVVIEPQTPRQEQP